LRDWEAALDRIRDDTDEQLRQLTERIMAVSGRG
jgi:hypothetical protein